MFFGLEMAKQIADKNQRVLEFDTVATNLLNMEALFRQSMDADSELYTFLAQTSSEPFRVVLADFSKGMLQHLSKEKELNKDCPKPKMSQYDTYLNAFLHMLPTNGYSMSQYLDAENRALGRFFEANLEKLEALNAAFLQHLKVNGVTSIMRPSVAPAMHR